MDEQEGDGKNGNKETPSSNGHRHGHRLCVRFNSNSSPPSQVSHALSRGREDSNGGEVVMEFENIELASNQSPNGADKMENMTEETGSTRASRAAQRLSMGNIRLRRSNSPGNIIW